MIRFVLQLLMLPCKMPLGSAKFRWKPQKEGRLLQKRHLVRVPSIWNHLHLGFAED